LFGKPRWSPDGRLIYFISTRSGFFNVWAIRFDTGQGRASGQPFQVAALENPAQTFADLDANSISISRDRPAFSMKETSGSVWMLDDVDNKEE
jgi:Tol biopolymer transport system component